MPLAPRPAAPSSAAVQAYLLGRIDLQTCLVLQERIAREVGARDDGQIAMLVCEHPPTLTIGRGGSPAEIQADFGLLRQRRVEVAWVKRGGGCLVHAPGQLAVYPIVPLAWHGLTVGDYLDQLQGGILRAMEELRLAVRARAGQYGVWGRTGQVAFFGIAVRDGVTRHGAFVNVDPPKGLFRLLDSDADDGNRPSSLVAERCGPVKMTLVKTEVLRHLTAALGCDRYHVYTGHPWLRGNTAPVAAVR